jgi:hypothetical protein
MDRLGLLEEKSRNLCVTAVKKCEFIKFFWFPIHHLQTMQLSPEKPLENLFSNPSTRYMCSQYFFVYHSVYVPFLLL